MAKDFFEKMFSDGIFNDDFFKSIDEMTKNLQTSVHTICEKYQNGEMVSKDEEKYENGKKTLDIHQSKNVEDEAKVTDNCKCNIPCSSCKAKASSAADALEERDKEIVELQKKLSNAEYENKMLTNKYNAVCEQNKALTAKLNKFKSLFDSEF